MAQEIVGVLMKWFGDAGYGFAHAPRIEEGIFIHVKDITFKPQAPLQGMRLRFTVQETPRGLRGVDVRRVDNVGVA